MSGLAVSNLSFSYGPKAALDDVSFRVAPGDFCALLGPNGAGKTTLFALLTRLFLPSQGRIEIDGIDGIAIAGFGTDGQDGDTDAAGAMVDGQTCNTARHRGFDPTAFLERNDSHAFFNGVGGLIRTGPTRTNVMDVVIALIH